MKTLADLKRDIAPGTVMEMTHNACTGSRIATLLGVPRYVIKRNTTGIVLSPDKDATKGSHMDYPAKAALCEYDGETLKIYNAGYRPLTAQEQSIMDNVPSKRPENKDAVWNEVMTDGTGFYYKDKQYYKDHDAEYLAGHETVRGMRYDFNTKTIYDESIKGELSLAYIIHKQ